MSHRRIPIRFVSRLELQDLPAIEGLAILSVDDINMDCPAVANAVLARQVIFADRDFDTMPGYALRPHLARGTAFLGEKASLIKAFGNAAVRNRRVREIIVQCKSGRSRSAAIALALSELHELPLDKSWVQAANPTVYCRLVGLPREELPSNYFGGIATKYRRRKAVLECLKWPLVALFGKRGTV